MYFEPYMYQNGYLNLSLLSSNGIFYGTNEFRLLVNISNYHEDDAGEYFVIVYTYPHILISDYECHKYFEFVIVDLSVGLPVWRVDTLQIHTTGNTLLYTITVCLVSCIVTLVNLFQLSVPPEVMVVADELSLEMGESTNLNCTASNGVPESHVSWIKNGHYLINATTITIPVNKVLNVEDILPFGEYTCIVYNDFYTSSHTTLIQEKGILLML